MSKQREKRGFSNFGFSTILLSFVMICVVTFSILSLITAYSDYKLSKKVADKNVSYYAAEESIYETLATIDKQLMEYYSASSDADDYYTSACDYLESFGEVDTSTDTYQLTLEEQISTDQWLSVKLAIQYPMEGSDTFYQILEWKSVYKTIIPEDDTLNLIQ